MRFGKFKTVRITLLSQFIHYRTSRIAQPHNLRALVKRLTHSIIYSVTKNLKLEIIVHSDYLRMSSRYKECQKWE